MEEKQLLPHQQRVVDEKLKLDTKITNLQKFIETNELFKDLHNAEKQDLIQQLNFEAIRLGVIAESVKEIEPFSRDVNAALINLSSMQGTDFSSTKNMTPNGFTSREICAIARYLGLVKA